MFSDVVWNQPRYLSPTLFKRLLLSLAADSYKVVAKTADNPLRHKIFQELQKLKFRNSLNWFLWHFECDKPKYYMLWQSLQVLWCCIFDANVWSTLLPTVIWLMSLCSVSVPVADFDKACLLTDQLWHGTHAEQLNSVSLTEVTDFYWVLKKKWSMLWDFDLSHEIFIQIQAHALSHAESASSYWLHQWDHWCIRCGIFRLDLAMEPLCSFGSPPKLLHF